MAVRVTRAGLEAAIGVAGTVRVTRIQLSAAYNDRTKPIRVTRVQAQVAYNDRTNPVRVTRMVAQVLRSIEDAPEVVATLPAVPDREPNPYRPTLPDEIEAVSPLLFDHLKEQTETIRLQHNVTQAGDSTFPWEELTKVGPERQYTLGSLGRFYHDDYGIILARYCQFTRMAEASWPTGPVGYLRSESVVSWRVTNDIALSSPDLVAGIMGAFRSPKEGWYGWVLTQGANHAPLLLNEEDKLSQTGQLVWKGVNLLGSTGSGRVLGRAVAPNHLVHRFQNQMDTGTVMLGVEGPSIESLRALLGGSFDGLEDQIRKIQATLEALGADTLIENLNTLLAEVESQGTEIADLQKLKSQIAEIRRKLDQVTGDSGLTALYDRITNEQLLITDPLSEAIRRLTDRLIAVENALNNLPPAQTPVKSYVPLVDGGIPPQLVYLPNGELVLVEVQQ